jgi:hypothetical protein
MDCGTHTITGGTGKYTGITGREPFTCITKPAPEGQPAGSHNTRMPGIQFCPRLRDFAGPHFAILERASEARDGRRSAGTGVRCCVAYPRYTPELCSRPPCCERSRPTRLAHTSPLTWERHCQINGFRNKTAQFSFRGGRIRHLFCPIFPAPIERKLPDRPSQRVKLTMPLPGPASWRPPSPEASRRE